MRVRQALAATIDKEALVELALFGQGEPTFSPIPPSHPYFNKTLKFNPPDIAKAKKLLAEAGFPNGFDVPMQVPQEREQRVRVGVAVRDMARAAGIRISVERVPFASYAATIAGKAQMYVDGYFARPTMDTALYPFYHSTGSWNRQLWLYKETRIDQILDDARKTNDEAARKALLEKFPAFRARQFRLEQLNASRRAAPTLEKVTSVTVKVVVNVVHHTDEQNISDAQIKSQIVALNRDYSAANADKNITPPVWQGVIGNAQIKFALATKDPKGKTTNGITRTKTTKGSFGTDDHVKRASTGGATAWPASKYLNLWACSLGGGTD